jgi:Ser/Thr protein kinase RdoA (MazF antagonist)
MSAERGSAGVAEVLRVYPGLSEAKVTPLEGGLINRTFLVDASSPNAAKLDPARTFVLQSLHPIFKEAVHEDIEAITRHIEKKGLITPRLVKTQAGGLFHLDSERVVWRMMTYIPARAYSKLPNHKVATNAGALVARFHTATADLQHTFAFTRPGVHETAAHLQTLEDALASHKAHRHYDAIAPLAEALLRSAQALPSLHGLKPRIAHGDLKISNLLFDEHDEGVCLVDLDTMAHMPLAYELGDAWRSWCNPAGEDETHTHFDLELFEASATGYLAHAQISPEERNSLPAGIETITLELSARFLADALLENYFGWNAQKYPDRSTHNRVRAQGQLSLAQSIHAQKDAIARVLENA